MLKIKYLAAVVAATLGLGLVAVLPAQAAEADTVISVTIKNKPDNGYGTPSHWADLNFTRTVTAHPQATAGTYEVTVTDAGTFTTRKNAGSPNNDVTIARKLPGTYTSTVHYGIVTGSLDLNKAGDLDGNVYDVKAGVNPPSTPSWGTILFEAGATGGDITSYQFLYRTLDEQWDERWNDGTDDRFDDNNAGQYASAGDITGKLSSKLTVANKCRASKADKRNVWSVTNAQGDRARSFAFWVKYNGHYSATQHESVNAGQTIQVITPGGGRITIMYYDGYGVQKRAYAYSKASILCA